MNFITGKLLCQEEAKRFQERYTRREQKLCVHQYFVYQDTKAELLEELDDELFRMKKEDIEDCNDLQVRQLNA